MLILKFLMKILFEKILKGLTLILEINNFRLNQMYFYLFLIRWHTELNDDKWYVLKNQSCYFRIVLNRNVLNSIKIK